MFFFISVSGALVLLWRRGPNVLTASQLMVTQDERIRLMDGYNLEITELEPQDAGDYVCQISDKVNKDQVHTVEILGKCGDVRWLAGWLVEGANECGSRLLM